MPTLPDWTSIQGPQAQPAGGVAGYRPNQGPDLTGAKQAGAEMQQAAQIVADTNLRQDAITAQAKANELTKARTLLEYDPKTGARSVLEGDAAKPEFVTTYQTRFQDAVKGLRDSLSTDSQRAMFDRHAEVQGLQFQSALLQHQAQQTERFNDSTDNATVKLAVDAIARAPTDIITYGMKMAEITGAVTAMAKRKGITGPALDELMASTKSTAIVARIEALAHGVPGVVEADPDQAMLLFKMEQGNLTAQAQKALTPELLQAGVATKAQTMGAQLAAQFDYLHTADAQKAIDGMNLPPMLATAVRAEVEHRHAVQQSDADKSNAIYVGKLDEMVQRGMSLVAIAATPEFAAVRDKGTVLKLIRERTEHAVNLQNAIENRDYTKAMRLRAEQTYNAMGKTFAYSDPMVLAAMTRPQVAALQLELGAENTQHLLAKYDSFAKSEAKLREAKIDHDQFITIAGSLGMDIKPTSKSGVIALATAKDRVEAAIDQWQQANGNKEMPRDQKDALMRKMVATQITVGGLWNSTDSLLQVPETDIKKVVVPDVDRGQIIDRLRKITGKPDYKPSDEDIARFYLRRKQGEAVGAVR